jgi:hypothetical protein
MRAVVLAAALAVPLAAQTPSIVHVLADESQVLVGRTLKLRAVVRDAAGNAIPSAAVTWSINQAAAGSIAADGMFTAKGLATVRVTARSGSVSGEAAIQTIPSRVAISPDKAELDVGRTQKFQATAYDADGNPIPGVTFSWSLTNQRQGSSSLGRIDSTGTLTATGEGGIWVWATYTYNESFPGLQRQWVAYAPVTANVPMKYELRRAYTVLRQTRKSWTLRPRQSMIWSADDGQLLFNASLGGLANALVSWKDGSWKVVSAGGVPRFGRGSIALELRNHSVTRDGQILTYEDTNGNGTELNLGTRDGVTPFLNNNVPLGASEGVSGLYITRNSYASSGYAMVRANFRYLDDATTYVGVFRGNGRVDELLLSTKDTLEGVAAPFTVDTDFGIASDGTAFYSVTSSSNRVFYRHDYNGRKRLVGVGDTVLNSKVRRFLGGQGNSPSVWFDDDGTALVCVELEDLSQYFLSYAPDGALTTLRVNSQAGILWRHPAQGALVYGNPYNNQGNGVYLWQKSGLKQVYLLSKKVLDQTIQAIESGTIDKLGNVTLMLRGDRNALMVVRMGDEPRQLFAAGDEIPVEAPVNLFTFIGGARVGPPHVQAGGNSGSIAEFDGTDWNLTLGIGERLFGTTMWFGGSHGSTYNMRKAPSGDLYFINGTGISKIPRGSSKPEAAIAFPLRLENNTLTVNAPGQLDVNAEGAVLFHSSTSAGDNRMFIWRDGQAKQILVLSSTASTASTIDGRVVSSFDSFAFDNAGRVLAQLRFRNLSVPALAVWDGGKWKTVAMPNETQVAGRTLTSLPNTPRAAGGKLVSGLTLAGGVTVIGEWTGTSWDVAVSTDTVMPNGQVANSIGGIDANTGGDVLFQFSNGATSIVLRREGKLYQVHNFFRPTGEGDWLIRILSMDLRDDGTVWLLAVTEQDEVVLYEARPWF